MAERNAFFAGSVPRNAFTAQLKPVMPEEYDRDRASPMPYLEAFGAGMIDPGGLTGAALSAAGADPYYQRRLQEMRAQSPAMAGAGSLVLPMGVVGGLLRRAGELTGKELMEALLLAAGIGTQTGPIADYVSPNRPAPRPQSRYPTGGAY